MLEASLSFLTHYPDKRVPHRLEVSHGLHLLHFLQTEEAGSHQVLEEVGVLV